MLAICNSVRNLDKGLKGRTNFEWGALDQECDEFQCSGIRQTVLNSSNDDWLCEMGFDEGYGSDKLGCDMSVEFLNYCTKEQGLLNSSMNFASSTDSLTTPEKSRTTI